MLSYPLSLYLLNTFACFQYLRTQKIFYLDLLSIIWTTVLVSRIISILIKGDVIIDDGALNALKKGKSLLAAGIKTVRGNFNKGDHIKILDKNMNEFARGLSSFTSAEISKIKGQHSNTISSLLGYVSKSEVIHKDDMVRI